MTESYQEIVKNFVRFGESSDDLCGAVVVGSQARESYQADKYSDLDFIMIVENTEYFLLSDEWLKSIGNFHISFIENVIGDYKERRILFDNALDVDFLIIPKSEINAPEIEEKIKSFIEIILRRGYCILIDKIGLKDIIKEFNSIKNTVTELTESDFSNIVNDFWYHCIWSAKKILRGEIWAAKFCVDSYMKSRLLTIIESYAHMLYGLDYDTWHDGRFIDTWAEKWIAQKLPLCFAHYDKKDIISALLNTMELFRLIAVNIAEKRSFPYPKSADDYASAYIAEEIISQGL